MDVFFSQFGYLMHLCVFQWTFCTLLLAKKPPRTAGLMGKPRYTPAPLSVSGGGRALPALPAPVLCPGPSVSPAGPLSVHLQHQTAFFLLSNPDLSLQLKPICLSYPLGIFWKKCSSSLLPI